MAYLGGNYTSIDNAGDLFYAWALTNGWTQNYSSVDGTGKRYHIQKSIGGTDFFFNFRTADGTENMSDFSWYTLQGIALNGSLGWINDAGATVWHRQTGFSTLAYDSLTPAMGVVHDIKASGGAFHFFATPTNLTAVFETESEQGDWRMFTVGALGGYPLYAASGGSQYANSSGTSYDILSAYLQNNVYSADNTAISAFHDGTYWYGYTSYDYSGVYSFRPQVGASSIAGSVAAPIVAHSPDSFRGNAQLAPSSVCVTKGIANEQHPVADIEGVKFINMTNYTNGQEIVYDSDTYKLFRIFNPDSSGVAFLK